MLKAWGTDQFSHIESHVHVYSYFLGLHVIGSLLLALLTLLLMILSKKKTSLQIFWRHVKWKYLTNMQCHTLYSQVAHSRDACWCWRCSCLLGEDCCHVQGWWTHPPTTCLDRLCSLQVSRGGHCQLKKNIITLDKMQCGGHCHSAQHGCPTFHHNFLSSLDH